VFTLLEAVAVMAIIGILSGIAVVGYNGVRRGQMDAAGQPVLGAALVDGRRVVAVSAQKTRGQFPAQDVLLAALMGSRDVSVNGYNVTYTLGGFEGAGRGRGPARRPQHGRVRCRHVRRHRLVCRRVTQPT